MFIAEFAVFENKSTGRRYSSPMGPALVSQTYLEGNFVNGTLNGEGISLKLTHMYVGSFKDGNPHGPGILYGLHQGGMQYSVEQGHVGCWNRKEGNFTIHPTKGTIILQGKGKFETVLHKSFFKSGPQPVKANVRSYEGEFDENGEMVEVDKIVYWKDEDSVSSIPDLNPQLDPFVLPDYKALQAMVEEEGIASSILYSSKHIGDLIV